MYKEEILIDEVLHCLMHMDDDLNREDFSLNNLNSLKHTLDHAMQKITDYYKEKDKLHE